MYCLHCPCNKLSSVVLLSCGQLTLVYLAGPFLCLVERSAGSEELGGSLFVVLLYVHAIVMYVSVLFSLCVGTTGLAECCNGCNGYVHVARELVWSLQDEHVLMLEVQLTRTEKNKVLQQLKAQQSHIYTHTCPCTMHKCTHHTNIHQCVHIL